MNLARPKSVAGRLRSRETLRHLMMLGCCLLCLYIQLSFRVPGRFLFVLVPWLSAALLFLQFALFVTYVLQEPPPADEPLGQSLKALAWASGWLVRIFVYYSLFLFANGALDTSVPREQEAQVVEIAGGTLDVGIEISYTWAKVTSWERPGGIERILLQAAEHRSLWGGEPILVHIRSGYFGLPWIFRLEADDGKRYEAVLRLAPSASQARRSLIMFYMEHRRFDQAATAYGEYFRLHPNHYEFAQQIGKAYAGMGRWSDTVAVMEPFVTRRPSYEVSTIVGYGMSRVGRKEDAVKLLAASIPLDPQNWWAYYFLGYVYGSMGKYDEAIAAFQRTVAIRPPFPEVEEELRSLQVLRDAHRAAAARQKQKSSP